MAIELSTITFTELDDIVPQFGEEVIFNIGVANTLAGDDIITGTAILNGSTEALSNSGIFNTDDGNDIITGIGGWYSPGILHWGYMNTGDGNDVITGISFTSFMGIGSYGAIDTGNGDDVITGISGSTGIRNEAIINTGNGNDLIRSQGNFLNRDRVFLENGNDSIIITGDQGILFNFSNTEVVGASSIIDTGGGKDIIISNDIYNDGVINTGNDEDSIIFLRTVRNYGGVFLGEDNDSITADTDFPDRALENFNFIGTGDGNDTITTTGVIYNEGVIETGNGDDSIIVDGGIDNITGTTYGIKNNGGAINMGDGNDSIIANEGFESGLNSSGAWFLGEGNDYIKGYGSGDFYGGNGNDTLELTPGIYTVGIWGEGGESPIFTKDSQLMITSEFEKLKAGGTMYDFTSLTAGQIITVV